MTERRRLLMVAYHFPPVVSVGVERSLQHARHLPASGWDPVVISPATSAYRSVDPASVARIPAGVEVHPALGLEPGHVRRAVGALLRRRPSVGPRPAGPAAARATSRALPPPLERAWGSYVRTIFFPDEQFLWLPGAGFAGWRAHRERAVDAVYSSAPPMSGHLVAAVLRRLLDVPWVADFRDPWIGNAYAAPVSPLHARLRASLERGIVRRADAVVFASRQVQELYAARYPRRADRFTTIPNGYDATELADLAQAEAAPPADGTFRLTFAGSIQYVPELELILDGLERLLARRGDLRERLTVEYVGWFSPETERTWNARAAALAPVLRRAGFLPRREAMTRLRGSSASLLVLAGMGGREDVAPAKLFDAIGLGLPVLAVAPPGEARRILAELSWGVAADPTPDAVADALERMVEAPPQAGTADPEGRYERRALSRRLVEVLDRIIAKRRSGDGPRTPRRS